MTFLLNAALILITLAIFILLPIRKKDVEQFANVFSNDLSLKQMTRGKDNKIIIWFRRIKTMLKATGQGSMLVIVVILSLILTVAGVIVGILFGNYFLIPILAIVFGMLPFLYVQLQYIDYKHFVVEELETALSIVTSSYERSENIVYAIEENIDHIGLPLKSIFEEFLFAVNQANVSISTAIEDMKLKVNNFIFIEWCETLKRCAHDRTLKASLRPVVEKLSDIKIVTAELKNILYNAKRTFFQLLVLSIIMLGLAFFILPRGFNIVLPATSTNLIMAINIALIIGATFKAIIETKDVDFDI